MIKATGAHYGPDEGPIDWYRNRKVSIEKDDTIIRFETAGTRKEKDLPFGSAGVAFEMSVKDARAFANRILELLDL